jgi:hypothetical protein
LGIARVAESGTVSLLRTDVRTKVPIDDQLSELLQKSGLQVLNELF